MVLRNLKMVGSERPVDIKIAGHIIADTGNKITTTGNEPELCFNQELVFPGLINSHDHLDFNLFPQLGNRIYNNYTEWGTYIHKEFKAEIAAVLHIPLHLRTLWGIYKNLLCGVTTVVNHGERLLPANSLINVFENTHNLHSVAFEKYWKVKLNNPLKNKLPVVIHTGEGTDSSSAKEVSELINWNKLGRRLVGIHAVAMTIEQAREFEAVVWCPGSNYFLLNKTAEINGLKQATAILFGTDSTLTANWNIWGHIKMARANGMMSDAELYQSLNITAADTWKINTGEIANSNNADLVIAKAQMGSENFDAFFNMQPQHLQLVMHHGNIRLFDESLLPQLVNQLKGKHFSLVQVNNSYKYVEGNLSELTTAITSYYHEVEFPVSVINYQTF